MVELSPELTEAIMGKKPTAPAPDKDPITQWDRNLVGPPVRIEISIDDRYKLRKQAEALIELGNRLLFLTGEHFAEERHMCYAARAEIDVFRKHFPNRIQSKGFGRARG